MLPMPPPTVGPMDRDRDDMTELPAPRWRPRPRAEVSPTLPFLNSQMEATSFSCRRRSSSHFAWSYSGDTAGDRR